MNEVFSCLKRHLRGAIRAFSLVEMLMALLVASLLLAALAPVMTKKIRTENINISGNNQSFNPIIDEEGFECFNVPGSYKIPSGSTYAVPGVLHVLMVSGGGGGGSASKGKTESKTFEKAGSGTTVQTSAPVTITENMENVNVINLIGGGAGGGGAASYGTSSNSTSTTGGKTTSSASINGCPSGSVFDKNRKNCVYSVSNANWANANSYCNGLTAGNVSAGDWKLPTQAEMINNWSNDAPGGLYNIKYWSNESRSGNSCNGAAHYAPYFVSGSSWTEYGKHYGCNNESNSFRCVLSASKEVTIDTTITQYNTIIGLSSFSAAGGGAAPAILDLKELSKSNANAKNAYNALQNAIKENIGGTIYISSGNGGSGGSSTTSYSQRGSIAESSLSGTTNGSNGGESCVVVTKPQGGAFAFKICAKGGMAGTNRVISTEDDNAAQANNAQTSNGCYYQTGTNTPVNFNCSGGNAGSNGINANYKECTNSNTTGYNYAACSNAASGGLGASGITINGAKYGLGGDGAGISISADGGASPNIKTPLITEAKPGTPGYGKISYDVRYQGNPGGGGAGGTMAVEHLNTRGDKVIIQLTVGKGGEGGLGGESVSGDNGNPGSDGGDTTLKVIDFADNSVEYANYTVYGGKGGGAGKNDGAPASVSNPNPSKGGLQNTAPGLNLSNGHNFTAKNGGHILGLAGDDGNFADKTGGDGGTSGLSAGTLNASTFKYYGGGNSLSSAWNGQGWNTTASNGIPLGGITIESFRNVSKDKFPSKGGWGGGGGGFSLSDGLSGIGAGGNGMPGYVCVWWLNGQ